MRKTILAIAAVVLAACQPASEQNAAQTNAAGNVTAQVSTLPVAQRNAVFLRAIRDAGLSCQGVTTSEQVADVGGKPAWRAECDDGTAHMIQVTADGTAVVTSPTSAK